MPKVKKGRREPVDYEIGQRVRVFREAAGMSQTDLGTATGVTFQQIQKYEKGANRLAGSRLVKVAQALKCKPADLFGELGETNGGTGGKSAGVAMLEQMAEPGAVDMVRAFNNLPSSKVRNAITHLIVSLARG
jgi:transcriptional regulator with XRE-family HTH domain